MGKETKKEIGPMQVRIPRDDKRRAELASKIEKIAEVSGLSVNDVVNLAVAAGIPMVEQKLVEIHSPAELAAA